MRQLYYLIHCTGKGKQIPFTLSVTPIHSGRDRRRLPPTIVLSLFLFFLPGCSDEKAPDSPVETVSLHLKSAGGLPIRHLDIFFFNDDALARLDAYQHIPWTGESTVRCASTAGAKRIVVLANEASDKLVWSDVHSYEGLRNHLSDLRKEDPEHPLMSGAASLPVGYDRKASIVLEPLLSRVELRSLRCDFSGRSYEGETMKEVKVYLINVSGSCETTREDSFPLTDVLNQGRLDDRLNEEMVHPEMLQQSLPSEVGTDVTTPGISLYCYPNGTLREGTGRPFTRLVVEGKIMGKTYYYPVNLPGMERNTRYQIDLTLTRLGTTDPDVAAEGGMVTVRCEAAPWTEKKPATILFRMGNGVTKALNPKEDVVNDINLFVFNQYGVLEACTYSPSAEAEVDLFPGEKYDVYATGNIGYAISGIRTIDDLFEKRYYLIYPDEYRTGIPMSTHLDGFQIDSTRTCTLPLERMMGKITLEMDRTGLDKDVRILVRQVSIGNSPRSATLFGRSKARTRQDVFPKGFTRGVYESDALNIDKELGHSWDLSLYLLENMQGDELNELCPYVEWQAEYYSPTWHTKAGKYLIYRFYLQDEGEYSIERNCHYHYTIRPKGDGLQARDNWQLDRSALESGP